MNGRTMKRDYTVVFLFILILILSASLRFSRIDWDENRHLHPDERFLSMVVNDINWPNATAYFDTANSPLNPHNTGKNLFVYGTFPVFLTKLVGDLIGYNGYDSYTWVGRILSGIFDMLTLVVLFLTAKRLFGERVALLTALLFAVTVLHIQHTHFFVVDLFATFFITLAFYFLVLLMDSGKKVHAVLLGVSWGFALASKLSTLYFGIMIFLGCILLVIKELRTKRNIPKRVVFRLLVPILISVLLIAISSFVVFRIFQPYAFEGPNIWNIKTAERFVANFQELSRLHAKGSGFVPMLQWRHRSHFYQIENLTLWGLGIPLSIIFWLGILLGLYLLFIKKDKRFLLPLTWVIFVLVFQALTFVKYLRYLLPGTPFMVLFGGIFLAYLTQNSKGRFNWRNVVAIILVLGCVFWAFAFTNIYFQRVSRIQASVWIYDNVPSNSTVANESWDDNIPFHLPGKESPGSFLNFETLGTFGEDNDEKINAFSEQLSRIDYIFLTSNRVYKVIPRLPEKYPFSSRYYDLLFKGELGFQLEKTFTNYPNLFGIEINDDSSEESFTVYDHPKVIIFKKVKNLGKDEIFELIKGNSNVTDS